MALHKVECEVTLATRTLRVSRAFEGEMDADLYKQELELYNTQPKTAAQRNVELRSKLAKGRQLLSRDDKTWLQAHQDVEAARKSASNAEGRETTRETPPRPTVENEAGAGAGASSSDDGAIAARGEGLHRGDVPAVDLVGADDEGLVGTDGAADASWKDEGDTSIASADAGGGFQLTQFEASVERWACSSEVVAASPSSPPDGAAVPHVQAAEAEPPVGGVGNPTEPVDASPGYVRNSTDDDVAVASSPRAAGERAAGERADDSGDGDSRNLATVARDVNDVISKLSLQLRSARECDDGARADHVAKITEEEETRMQAAIERRIREHGQQLDAGRRAINEAVVALRRKLQRAAASASSSGAAGVGGEAASRTGVRTGSPTQAEAPHSQERLSGRSSGASLGRSSAVEGCVIDVTATTTGIDAGDDAGDAVSWSVFGQKQYDTIKIAVDELQAARNCLARAAGEEESVCQEIRAEEEQKKQGRVQKRIRTLDIQSELLVSRLDLELERLQDEVNDLAPSLEEDDEGDQSPRAEKRAREGDVDDDSDSDYDEDSDPPPPRHSRRIAQ